MIFKRKKNQTQPELSTASLPDIVFMLLFFFMVTTVIQDDQSQLKIEKPQAKLTEKIESKDASALLVISVDESTNIPIIQFEQQNIDAKQVGKLIQEKMLSLPENQQGLFFTMIKADKNLPMEVITEIKQQLRDYQLLKVKYVVDSKA